MKKISFVLAALFIFQGCAGMSRGGEGISDAEINAESAKAYKDVVSKSKVSTNKEWSDMVQRVARRIASASGENFQWEYVLLENPEPNAWCMPGGKIAVYTGIMPILKTEGALAAVLGHEVAHATKRHGKERYERAIAQQPIGIAVAIGSVLGSQVLCKTEACKRYVALGGAAAGFAMAIFEMKYSRGDETEADKFGQVYMAKAGYDPSESIKLWERMGASGGKKPPEFLSTHPSDETRRGNLTSWLPETNAIYQKSSHKYGIGAPIR